MPDPIFAELYRDTEQLTWESTEQVRRLGLRRTRRTYLAAGLASAAAVAVVAVGAIAVAGRPDAAPPLPPATNAPDPSTPPAPTSSVRPDSSLAPTSPTTTPSSSVPPTRRSTAGTPSAAIPTAAMLRVADLPSGFRADGSDLDGDWSFNAGVSAHCDNEGWSTPRERALRGAVFRGTVEQTVIERVERHSEETAKSTMAAIRQLVAGCGPGVSGKRLTLFDSSLAGDESLLIGVADERSGARWLFVRQGDLLAQVWLKGVDAAEDPRIAQRAAARLCAGTDAC